MKRFCVVILTSFLTASPAKAANDWTQQSPSTSPSARQSHRMAYIGGNRVLMFGSSALNDETWVYHLSPDEWIQQSPSSSPSGRYGQGMAYIGGDKVLLFGGCIGVPPWTSDETWVYDFSEGNWTELFPSSKPSARFWCPMAYIGGDKVLLFGGYEGFPLDDETWVYDLSEGDWTQLFPSSKPSERYAHAMAYIGGDRVLLFGGNLGADLDDETWVFDLSANDWIQQFPTTSPSARRVHAMAHIGGVQVLLFGGWDNDYNDETWVFDLSEGEWAQDANTTQPSARMTHGLSETSMNGSSYPVLFGGNDGSYDDETWVFGGGDYHFPFGPLVLDINLISVNTARISWSAVVGATEYELYRSTTAYLNAFGIPWLIVPAPLTHVDFTDGIGNANTNYYFRGRARSATQTSLPSNIVGECDFDADIP